MSSVIPANVRAVFFDAVGTLLFPEPCAHDIYAEVAAAQGLRLSQTAVLSRFRRAYQAEEAADRRSGLVTNEEREVARWRRVVYETLNGVNDPEACFRQLFEHFAARAWRVNEFADTLFANSPIAVIVSVSARIRLRPGRSHGLHRWRSAVEWSFSPKLDSESL